MSFLEGVSVHNVKKVQQPISSKKQVVPSSVNEKG